MNEPALNDGVLKGDALVNSTTPIADGTVPVIDGQNPETVKAMRAALELLFVGDALSMPVHWYYRPGDILRAFGTHGITRMEAAPLNHPSSIMSLHSTRSGGRSAVSPRAGKAPEIIGDVILKGRRHLWGESGRHYHHGMPAGENTLNAWCARWLIEHLSQQDEYLPDAWIEDYIARMTADPPAHPDTYAESYHRGFFAKLTAGRPPNQCGAVTHDTPSMGALVTVAPLALNLLASQPVSAVQGVCREHVWLTHPDEMLMTVVDAYVALLAELMQLAAERSDASALADHSGVSQKTAGWRRAILPNLPGRFASTAISVGRMRTGVQCWVRWWGPPQASLIRCCSISCIAVMN